VINFSRASAAVRRAAFAHRIRPVPPDGPRAGEPITTGWSWTKFLASSLKPKGDLLVFCVPR
jgi:hypothetical protein